MALDSAMPVSYHSTLNDFPYEPVTFKSEVLSSFDYLPGDPQMEETISHSHFGTAHGKLSIPTTDKLILESKGPALTSWTTTHPQHWTKEEVLDWIYYVVEQERLDVSRVHGEAYQHLTGQDLCTMTEADFTGADPYCGARLFLIFKNLLKNVSFIEPKEELDTESLDTFNTDHHSQQVALSRAVCSEAYQASHVRPNRQQLQQQHRRHQHQHHGGLQQQQQHQGRTPEDTKEDLVVYKTETDMKVDLPCLGTYSISTDIEFPTTSSAPNLFLSSATRLAHSATFTSPTAPSPPASTIPCSYQTNLPALSPTILSPPSSGIADFIGSSSSSLLSPTSSTSSTSLSSSSLSSFNNGSRRVSSSSISSSKSRSSTLSSSSLSSPSPSSSSLSISLSLSLGRNMSSSSSSSSSSANGRLEPTDSGYVSDESGAHSFMPPLAPSTSPRSSSLYGGVPYPVEEVDDPMDGLEPMDTELLGSQGSADVTGQDRKKMVRKNRPGTANKNNHLWEFVRDLLRDPNMNPKLLKWEDKEKGVFRFVQSEKVARLWGEKKNNPLMTYEKLSRAMRFCRSAGYFTSVPKNGKFPKKLCFMFGEKATGWKE